MSSIASKTCLARRSAVPTSGYDVVTLRVSAVDEEIAAAGLWELGTSGLETRERAGEAWVTAYFESGRAAAGGWSTAVFPSIGCRAEVVSVVALEETDWLEAYRRKAQPFALGRGFWVHPGDDAGSTSPESRPPAPSGRVALTLPARRAFGTGSHESTRLAVEILEDQRLSGRTVLDVGAGSGILSFVAAALGAARVFAVEVDPVAALVAAQNQVSNGLRFGLFAGRLDAIRARPWFDVVLVNIIPERIAADLPAIVGLSKPGGRLIVSGFLSESRESYQARLESLGTSLVEARELDGWSAFSMRRDAEA